MARDVTPETLQPADRARALIYQIGQSLLTSVNEASSGWKTCYARAERHGDSLGLNYFYFEDITESNKKLFRVEDRFSFYDQMMELADHTRSGAGKRWKACLCRIHKNVGNLDISFEFHRPKRWRESHLE